MAYDRSKEEQEILALIDKNDRGDKIQVSKIRIKGREETFADIRLMYTPEGEEDIRPTSKGVRVSTSLLPKIVAGLVDMLDDSEKAKLADTLKQAD